MFVRGRALTERQIAQIRDLRYRHGMTSAAAARIVGVNADTVRAHAPGHIGKIPNDKLRAAFLASRRSASEVALRVGWLSPRADASRVRRTLGITLSRAGGRQQYRRLIDVGTAERLADAIGVAVWEIMPDDEGGGRD